MIPAVGALALAVAAASVAEAASASGNGRLVVDFEGGLLVDLLGTLQFGGGGNAMGVPDALAYVPGLIALGVIGYAFVSYFGLVEIAGTASLLFVGFLMLTMFPPQPLGEPWRSAGGGREPMTEQVEQMAEVGQVVTVHLTPIVGTVALLATLSVATVVLTRSDQQDDPAVEPFETTGPTEVESLGTVAGRAADQLDGAESFENAIYEAWREMTASLSVENPESTTAREFADRAIEAGLSSDDVEELTTLFESVRYGNASVTERRRERARETLRHVEETYSEGSDE